MHRREHVTLLRSGRYGPVARTTFYATEIRANGDHRADTALLQPKEIALADQLVTSLKGAFEPEKYRDTYKERLEALIAEKVAGKATLKGAPARKMAPVIDIMQALQASLSGARKVLRKRRPRKERLAPARSEASRDNLSFLVAGLFGRPAC